MTKKELEAKVINAQSAVAKREAVLTKHREQLAKLISKGADQYDIRYKEDDIKTATNKLEDARRVLKNWQNKLGAQISRDAFIEANAPQVIKDFLERWNFAYVAGEGEGSARVIVEVDLRSSADEERRELYVDARDLQSTYQDDAGDEHTYTADQYKALLRQRGLEKLAEYQKIETVNGDVDPNANLTYGVDFDLGDLCTYRYADVGIETTKRITEIQEVYEGSKQTLSVVFGNDQMTSITKIIQREVF